MSKKQNIEPEDKQNLNRIYLFKKVSLIDKYNFYEYLSIMLNWGVWVFDTLESVHSKIKNEFFKEKIKELQTYVYSWDSFSKSMKKLPMIFSSAEVSIIEAWETMWRMSESMWKLSEDLRRSYELKSKVKNALTYPFIIFLFLLLSVTIVLIYVVPAIEPLFANSDTELPWVTKSLIMTSNFISDDWVILILLFLTLFVVFIWYRSTEKWRMNIDYMILWVPLIWTVYKNYLLSSIAWNIWSLVWSWVWVIKTLRLTWKSANNLVYESLIEDAIIKVSAWQKIVDSLKEADEEWIYFPVDFLQMMSVWERTATLETVSYKISDQYNKEVDYSLSRLTKWIEPIAIFISWIFVCWFAFAIFFAIVKVTDTVG